MVEGAYRGRAGDISGAPVVRHLFNIISGEARAGMFLKVSEFSLGHHLSAVPPWFGCPRPSPLVREQTRDVDLAHQATSNPTAFVLDGCAGSCHAGGLATCDR